MSRPLSTSADVDGGGASLPSPAWIRWRAPGGRSRRPCSSAGGAGCRRRGGAARVLVGAAGGLGGGGALRSVMAEIAGPESTFDWFGTFEGVLLPGAAVGALLGWAARHQNRWLVAAPLVFVLFTPTVLA